MDLREATSIVNDAIDEIGFDCKGETDASNLQVLQEVRDMCNADRCQSYGRSWACPPACGELSEYQQLIDSKQKCIVFQTVMQMEDSFDWETMQSAAETQAERLGKLSKLLKEKLPEAHILGTGTCTKCSKCTYPDEPCRFPEDMLVSMESAGLLVNDVCTLCNVAYNHGKDTICYSGCVLI